MKKSINDGGRICRNQIQGQDPSTGNSMLNRSSIRRALGIGNRHRSSHLRKNRRTTPFELLEPRQVLANGFLQGFAFIDGNNNNQLDDGELRKVGATIELRSGDGSILLATTATNVGRLLPIRQFGQRYVPTSRDRAWICDSGRPDSEHIEQCSCGQWQHANTSHPHRAY